MTEQPFSSIIVPVYNDNGRLRLCLASLVNQSYPADRYEIIVVDNGRNSNITETLLSDPRIRLIAEQVPGSYAARNTGIKVSRGYILAFTDADIEADRDWLSEGVAALSDRSGLGLIGGRIEFQFREPGNPNLAELCDSLLHFDQERNVKDFRYAVTGNMLTYRRVFDAVGYFDESYLSGGDKQWGNRVAQLGYAMAYAPRALVFHPARATIRELVTKARRIAGKDKIQWDSKRVFRSLVSIALGFFQGFIPPVAQIRYARRRCRCTVWRYGQVAAIFFLLKAIRAFERLRVSAGGEQIRD